MKLSSLFNLKKVKTDIDLNFKSSISSSNHKFNDYSDKTISIHVMGIIGDYEYEYFIAKEQREPSNNKDYDLVTLLTADNRKKLLSIFGPHTSVFERTEKIWSFDFKDFIFFVISSSKGTSYEVTPSAPKTIVKEFLINIHQKLYDIS